MWGNEYKSKQGNIGVARAIDYYVTKGYSVSIPMNDTQSYDLIVDDNIKLYRVSVKTTSYKAPSGNYSVQLKNSGGSSGKSVIRNFDKSSCDILFVLCDNNDIYIIPIEDVDAHSSLTLTEERKKYIRKLF